MRFTVQRYESVPTSSINPGLGGIEIGPELELSVPTNAVPPAPAGMDQDTLDGVTSEEQGSSPNSDPASPMEPATPEYGGDDEEAGKTDAFLDPTSPVAIPNNEVAYVPVTTLPGDEIAGPVAERGRSYAGRQTRRLVFKDGNCNVSSGNVNKRKRKYLVDIFTTLVDMKWRYNLLMFAASYLVTWFSFATLWYIIALVHGDHLHVDEEGWKPCMANVYDFLTALLFSIETQHTIGYGFRGMEANCHVAVVVLMAQSCLGVFIQSLMTGLIFAKLAQPKRRAHTIMFSRRAVISKRDGEYCLLFRVGDMRKSHFVGTSIRTLMVKDKYTKEGECIPLCQSPLEVQTETCSDDDFVFLVWPVTVIHKINSSSPLWNVSAQQLMKEQFEIIVILEGVVESTGMTTQVRTSYLPSEILWGHRLAPLLTYQKENGQYKIDYAQFHAVIPTSSMPDCSAKQLAEKFLRVDSMEETEDSNVEYISSDGYLTSPSIRISMLKRMRGGLKLRPGKNARRDKRETSTSSLKLVMPEHRYEKQDSVSNNLSI